MDFWKKTTQNYSAWISKRNFNRCDQSIPRALGEKLNFYIKYQSANAAAATTASAGTKRTSMKSSIIIKFPAWRAIGI